MSEAIMKMDRKTVETSIQRISRSAERENRSNISYNDAHRHHEVNLTARTGPLSYINASAGESNSNGMSKENGIVQRRGQSGKYTLRNTTLKDRILAKHGPDSKYHNKPHFDSEFDIKSGIDSTLTGNHSSISPTTTGRKGTIYEQSYSNPIGTNCKGKPASTLKVIVGEDENVVTAFPQ